MTSNGVIGCLVGHVERGAGKTRGANDHPELQYANTSITCLSVRDDGIEVTARNVFEHLDDETLVTYL